LGTFFRAFLGKGSKKKQKHQKNIFTKSLCRKLFPKKSTKTSMSVFPRLFCFIAFPGVSQRQESKLLQKTFYKKIVSKSFYKTIDKKIPNRFSLFFLITFLVFGRFSVRGVEKRIKKSPKKLTSPGTFLAPEEPTNHVGVRQFFFSAPCRHGQPKGWISTANFLSVFSTR
jgi:hypothetical protein